jgi:hypothetical protein
MGCFFVDVPKQETDRGAQTGASVSSELASGNLSNHGAGPKMPPAGKKTKRTGAESKRAFNRLE